MLHSIRTFITELSVFWLSCFVRLNEHGRAAVIPVWKCKLTFYNSSKWSASAACYNAVECILLVLIIYRGHRLPAGQSWHQPKGKETLSDVTQPKDLTPSSYDVDYVLGDTMFSKSLEALLNTHFTAAPGPQRVRPVLTTAAFIERKLQEVSQPVGNERQGLAESAEQGRHILNVSCGCWQTDKNASGAAERRYRFARTGKRYVPRRQATLAASGLAKEKWSKCQSIEQKVKNNNSIVTYILPRDVILKTVSTNYSHNILNNASIIRNGRSQCSVLPIVFYNIIQSEWERREMDIINMKARQMEAYQRLRAGWAVVRNK